MKEEDLRRLDAPPLWPEGLQATPAGQVWDAVLRIAGARPWDRGEVDQRIVQQVRDKTARVIDSQEQVGGYPHPPAATRKLDVPKEDIQEWLRGFSSQSR